jgi:hypothetical protein
VSRFDAARFLTGTYLLLGDILDLAGDAPTPDGDVEVDAAGPVMQDDDVAAPPDLEAEPPAET